MAAAILGGHSANSNSSSQGGLPPKPTASPIGMSSVLAMITSLVRAVPNAEFGALAKWMNDEAGRRREHIRGLIEVGTSVVWTSDAGRLTKGDIVAVGQKNARIRTEHDGELHVPLARLERTDHAMARLSSLPPVDPDLRKRMTLPAQPERPGPAKVR